jgi:PPIC-type PPIASE domain
MMGLKKYLFSIVLLFSIAACSQVKSNITKDDTVVAKLGKDYLVTAKELRKYVADWKYESRFRIKSEAYKNALNELTKNRLRLFDFFDRRLDENQDLMEKIRRIINNELMNAFFDKSFVDKYANEKTAIEAYQQQMDKEVICTDILLPVPKNPTKEKLDSLRTIASEIESGLNKNYDINGLLQQFSLKRIAIVSQKKITWQASMTNPISKIVFGLSKGFTRVIEAMDGDHVIKVVDVKKIKLEPFEKMKDEIVEQLKNGYYNEYNNAYDEFRNGLIDKSSIKWNQSGLDQIVKWSSDDERFYAGAYKDTIQNAISNGNNFEILSYKNGRLDLKEYLQLLEQVVVLYPNIILNSLSIKDFILDAAYDNSVVVAAKKAGIEKKLISPYTEDPVVADRLLYLYNQAVIEDSIPKTTPEALHKFYEDHKDSIFYQLKVVYLYARIYSDSANAVADINEIKKGTPFEKVKEAWLVKEFIRERDGSLKAYRTAGGDYLAKAAFKLSLNESAGPVEYDDSTKGKQFAVIKCFQIQPEKLLTYEDVKGERVEKEFKDFYRQKISDEVDARLKKKYGIEIFQKALSEAISSN